MVIVNGYICMNCCDIDKARLGQDPQQSTDQLQKQLKRHIDRLEPANFGPAVALGGSLQGPSAGNGAGGKARVQPVRRKLRKTQQRQPRLRQLT